MPRRLFDEDNSWLHEAHLTHYEICDAIRTKFIDLESLLKTDIDVRDFHYIAIEAVSHFCNEIAVSRRLGDSKSVPRPFRPPMPPYLFDNEE